MRCPKCEYVWDDDCEDDDLDVVDTRDYVVNPLTAQELMQREYYAKRFLEMAGFVVA